MPVQRATEAQRLCSALSFARKDLPALATLSRAPDDAAFDAGRPAAIAELEADLAASERAAREAADRLVGLKRAATAASERHAGLVRSLAAAKAIDEILRLGPNGLDARVAQLRSSMRDALDKALDESVTLVSTTIGKQSAFVLSEASRSSVHEALNGAQRSWFQAVCLEVEADVRAAIYHHWHPLEGAPSIQPPALFAEGTPAAPLLPDLEGSPGFWVAPEVPELAEKYEVTGFMVEFGRQIRGLLMPIGMGFAYLQLSMADTRMKSALALVLLPVAWWMTSRDRAAALEKRREDARRLLHDRLKRWVETRLERSGAHLKDHVRNRLAVDVRAQWHTWYARERLVTRVAEAAAELQRAGEEVKKEDALARDPKRAEVHRVLDALRPRPRAWTAP